VSAQVEWLVLETAKIIGMDIAGVDLLIDKNTYKVSPYYMFPRSLSFDFVSLFFSLFFIFFRLPHTHPLSFFSTDL
jgi:hypothetical protein